MATRSTEIAFIGLGLMGKPMAINLVRAGFHVTVHSRSSGPVQELAALGAGTAANPRDAARGKQFIITMLPDTPDVEKVTLGENGIAHSADAGTTLIDMSTISPTATRRVAAELGRQSIEMLDAPVSGGQVGAERATLSIMVGGPHETFQRAEPLLRVLGENIVHIGDAGAGQVAKACNQLIVGATIEAVAEALSLATSAGVDAGRVREALLGGFASSRVLEVHGRRMLDNEFTPGFRARLHRKDIGIVAELAAGVGLELPLARETERALQRLLDAGLGDLDHAALINNLRPFR